MLLQGKCCFPSAWCVEQPNWLHCSLQTFLQGQNEGKSLTGLRAALQPLVRHCPGWEVLRSAPWGPQLLLQRGMAQRGSQSISATAARGRGQLRQILVGVKVGREQLGAGRSFLLCHCETRGWWWWMLCAHTASSGAPSGPGDAVLLLQVPR